MPAILDTQTISGEIVLSERRVTSEFRIIEIHESIQNRSVRAEIELGPFVQENMPGGDIRVSGSSRRGVNVWNNEQYDAIRDTWTNTDLMAEITQLLSN